MTDWEALRKIAEKIELAQVLPEELAGELSYTLGCLEKEGGG